MRPTGTPANRIERVVLQCATMADVEEHIESSLQVLEKVQRAREDVRKARAELGTHQTPAADEQFTRLFSALNQLEGVNRQELKLIRRLRHIYALGLFTAWTESVPCRSLPMEEGSAAVEFWATFVIPMLSKAVNSTLEGAGGVQEFLVDISREIPGTVRYDSQQLMMHWQAVQVPQTPTGVSQSGLQALMGVAAADAVFRFNIHHAAAAARIDPVNQYDEVDETIDQATLEAQQQLVGWAARSRLAKYLSVQDDIECIFAGLVVASAMQGGLDDLPSALERFRRRGAALGLAQRWTELTAIASAAHHVCSVHRQVDQMLANEEGTVHRISCVHALQHSLDRLPLLLASIRSARVEARTIADEPVRWNPVDESIGRAAWRAIWLGYPRRVEATGQPAQDGLTHETPTARTEQLAVSFEQFFKARGGLEVVDQVRHLLTSSIQHCITPRVPWCCTHIFLSQ